MILWGTIHLIAKRLCGFCPQIIALLYLDSHSPSPQLFLSYHFCSSTQQFSPKGFLCLFNCAITQQLVRPINISTCFFFFFSCRAMTLMEHKPSICLPQNAPKCLKMPFWLQNDTLLQDLGERPSRLTQGQYLQDLSDPRDGIVSS